MSKRGRGGQVGLKAKVSLGLPVASVLNCADNTGNSIIYNRCQTFIHHCYFWNQRSS